MGKSYFVTWMFDITYANGHIQHCVWNPGKTVRPSDAIAKDMLDRYSNPEEGFAGYVTRVKFTNQKTGKTYTAARIVPAFLVF